MIGAAAVPALGTERIGMATAANTGAAAGTEVGASDAAVADEVAVEVAGALGEAEAATAEAAVVVDIGHQPVTMMGAGAAAMIEDGRGQVIGIEIEHEIEAVAIAMTGTAVVHTGEARAAIVGARGSCHGRCRGRDEFMIG